jgi:hypothetical protein
MKVKFSPQRSDSQIEYSFSGEVITATMNEVTDIFGLSKMPDGKAMTAEIETTLPVNPILSAKRENGVLWVELLNCIGLEATEAERFPDWQEVGTDG